MKEKSRAKVRLRAFFGHFRQYSLKQILSAAYIPAAILYYEIFFRIVSVKEPFTWINWLCIVFSSIALGLCLDVLSCITKNEKLNGFIAAVFLELLSLGFMITHFVKLEFGVYIGPQSVAGGATGITQHAGNYILDIITGNWPTILLFEAPVIIFLVLFLIFRLFCFKRFKALGYIQIILLAVICNFIVGVPITNRSPDWELLTSEFDYDIDVRYFEVQTATTLDVLYSIFHNPWKQNFITEDDVAPVSYDPDKYNMMDIDFDKMIDESTNIYVTRIHEYVRSLTPSEKNRYTGMFKGKNLIEITAESFTPYILDEELTPTLYKLVNNGFVFDDFYQPMWSGSTTTGEFQILTGLLPANGFHSMLRTADNNMYLTIGSQLLREDYTGLAFHNGTYTYFDRNKTHCNLGYTRFYANGNGMTGLSGHTAWPQSDVEMMEFAIPRFIDKEPFNAYFMTLSGHSKYDEKNFIVRRNIDEVRAWAEENGKDYTDAVLCYLAANLEFEKSMTYLLSELEAAGVLDDTVIVMTGDHYPYSLSDDYVIDDEGYVEYFDVEKNLENLFGYVPENEMDYSHNSLVIWTPSMDGENSVHISEPAYSADILPTLSNLFGLEFDSRLFAGRDVLAENTEPLVIFLNYNWLSERGYFNADTREYTPFEGMSYDAAGDPLFQSDAEYIKYMNSVVRNKMVLSQNIPLYDYYNVLFGSEK